MAAFRVVAPLTVFLDNLGAPCAGGSLEMYDTLTLDAKNVYSDEDLSTNLGSSVTLDSAGRAPSDIWGTGVYRVRLFTAFGVLVDEADPVQEEGAAGSAIPAQTGHSGKALFTNGSTMSWLDVEQLPDMTGQAGKVLGTDGTDAIWETPADVPDLPADGIEVTVSTQKVVRIGDMQFLFGTATMPITGTHTSSLAVVFSPAFNAEPWYVGATNMTGGISPSGAQGTITAQGATSTGFTINLDVNIDSVDAGWNINAAASVKWVAVGPVTP